MELKENALQTEIYRIRGQGDALTQQDLEALKRGGDILKKGGLVAFPTETVYGLGGNAFDPEAAAAIYRAKGRPSDNPLIVHIYRMEDLEQVASAVSEKAYLLAERFWPGPMTMILPKAKAVPLQTTGGLETVAVRMPSDPVAAALIRFAGGFVAAPSANISGRPSPTKARYVVEDMDGRIDMILDGGENEIGLESTIVDLTVDPPQILRPGFITARMLADVLGEDVGMDPGMLGKDASLRPKAPGMKYRHYAPRGEMFLVDGPDPGVIADCIAGRALQDLEQGEKVGLLVGSSVARALNEAEVPRSAESGRVLLRVIEDEGDQKEIAHRLYAILREFDDENVTRIYAEKFPEEGLGAAVNNRMKKAAGTVLTAGEER